MNKSLLQLSQDWRKQKNIGENNRWSTALPHAEEIFLVLGDTPKKICFVPVAC